MKRTLGRSGIEVGAVGMGCWAIGGPAWRGENPVGWGQVDDEESVRAIHAAIDLGANFFDTANVYGCGHSEVILGEAVKSRRDDVVIATKFGGVFDEESKQITGNDSSRDYIRSACDESLRRLQTDHIDLYQFHTGNHPADDGGRVRDCLEELVEEGKVRHYGWSTDDHERAAVFAESKHCTAMQQHLNVFGGNFELLDLCEKLDLASVIRGPLGMGLLTGKFDRDASLPEDDVRHGWNFKEGPIADQLEKLRSVRDILTSEGRTLAQGALAWLWARSEKTLPIPGFKSVKQVEENAGAMQFGPLSPAQMEQIEGLVRPAG